MGLKRPFDAEEMQEFNAKHARQLTYNPNQFDQSVPYHHPLDKTAVLGTFVTNLKCFYQASVKSKLCVNF